MTAIALNAYTGAALLGALAVLFLVARSVDAGWSLRLSGAYALLSVHYVNIGFHAARPPSAMVGLSTPVLVAAYFLISWALLRHLEVGGKARRWFLLSYAALLVLTLALFAAGSMTIVWGVALQTGVLVLWMALFLEARVREPGCGHGFNVLVLALFLVLSGLRLAGLLPAGMSRSYGVLPHALLGITMLTTGLLRSHRRLNAENRARQQAQRSLEELNARLEERVLERTRALEEQVQALESFNRSVSHDLRGPLGGIAALTSVALEQSLQGQEDRAREAMRLIVRQAETSQRLVDALLRLARADTAPLNRERIEVSEVVRSAVDAIPAQVRHNASIAVDARLPAVRADRELLQQLFVNLISNALKFSQFTEGARVSVDLAEQEGGMPVLAVRDNGVGLSPGQTEVIFQPFKRVHGERFAGTGVGLSIVRRIVERHGGRIWVESVQGKGATFYVALPTA